MIDRKKEKKSKNRKVILLNKIDIIIYFSILY